MYKSDVAMAAKVHNQLKWFSLAHNMHNKESRVIFHTMATFHTTILDSAMETIHINEINSCMGTKIIFKYTEYLDLYL